MVEELVIKKTLSNLPFWNFLLLSCGNYHLNVFENAVVNIVAISVLYWGKEYGCRRMVKRQTLSWFWRWKIISAFNRNCMMVLFDLNLFLSALHCYMLMPKHRLWLKFHKHWLTASILFLSISVLLYCHSELKLLFCPE